ncbi:Mitochondrial transcription factor 1 [Pyrenophora seminiperda CCB06]|uniref:rRNA adenine N(6)-methyltransferase n=1 Tax=Pyrenophora seminiperda CCB06 TaxID=1302712 RepID=A0A3M7M732_9PLEO|nr:Mitochondrial transcription factor 1 [Pyrenophora seminiperda CCB06]
MLSRNSWRWSASVTPRSQLRFATIKHGGKAGRPKGAGYWTDEKLATDGRYPLSQTMKATIHPDLEQKITKRRTPIAGASAKSGGVYVRAQLVSPDLCDDVLNYIGPSLDKHKGCDILDINPGAGLWSRKLHEYLQPRSHVLLEPRLDKFQRFLNPLLDAPGSKYSLVNKDPTALQTYRDMVTERVFPHQTVHDPEDPKAQEPNNSLLVTGSLVWDPRLPGMGFDSMAKQLFMHFATAIWANDLFYAYGLVRTLLWVQQDDASSTMAESVSNMHKANRLLEMTQNFNVIVKAARTARKLGKGSTGREPQYEIESTVRALKAGRERSMELPQHRCDYIHEFAADVEQESNGTGIRSSEDIQTYLKHKHQTGKPATGLLPQGYIDYYEQENALEEKYPDLNFDLLVSKDGIRGKKKNPIRGHSGEKEIGDVLKTSANVFAGRRTKIAVEKIADIGEAMFVQECNILGMKDGPQKDAAMAKLEELNASWEQETSKMANNYLRAPTTEVDERLAIRAPPSPRIQWDSRPFEPLTMHTNEAWPQCQLSLISSEPIPKLTGQSPDYPEWVHDFVFGLYAQPSDGINEALDKMQHGLSDIIDECPSLKDPSKGGRLQMNHLRAYQNWPFKAPGSDNNKFFRNKTGQVFGAQEKQHGLR